MFAMNIAWSSMENVGHMGVTWHGGVRKEMHQWSSMNIMHTAKFGQLSVLGFILV